MSGYSVLMSVYYKEKGPYLRRSVDSVFSQTVLPDDFVLVCDGPLTEDLDRTIEELIAKYPCIQTLRLERNMGLGEALSQGIVLCKNETIMRMDSDDVCLPDRAEIELSYLNRFDLVGSWISEFDGKEDNIIGIRQVPETYVGIRKFAKKKSPFNHPAVMFKRSTILAAGGYLPLLFQEDYYLWVRVLEQTDKVYNVQKVLVNMRSGLQMRARRGGKEVRKSLKVIRKYLLQHKRINFFEYCVISFEHFVFLHLPLRLKGFLYKKVLRRH